MTTETLNPERTAALRHELRTPVNHILGYSELLAEDVPAGSPEAESLAAIGVAAREVLRLINASLPPAGTTRPDALQALFAELRAPQARILMALKPDGRTIALLGHAQERAVADLLSRPWHLQP